jgi:murein DD-endopeptidase MepM/ murein hydrolase activator NlpD
MQKTILKSYRITIFTLCVLLAGLLSVGHAAPKASPTVIITPKKVGPGDLLLITVKNMSGPVEGTFIGKKLYFNPSKKSYQAVLGIDLFTEPGKYSLVITNKGTKLQRTVKVSKKDYPIQRLTLPKDMVVLSPENEARVEREQKKVATLWPVDSVRIWSGGFIDPLPGKKIGTPFGVRRIINDIPKNPHSGVDVTADEGEPVRAPNDGVVVLVDDQFYSGKSVILDHGQGIYTMFFHLSRINVRHGQAVMKGDAIAEVGSTGRSTGAHLHWGARVQGARIDPLGLIKLKLE